MAALCTWRYRADKEALPHLSEITLTIVRIDACIYAYLVLEQFISYVGAKQNYSVLKIGYPRRAMRTNARRYRCELFEPADLSGRFYTSRARKSGRSWRRETAFADAKRRQGRNVRHICIRCRSRGVHLARIKTGVAFLPCSGAWTDDIHLENI